MAMQKVVLESKDCKLREIEVENAYESGVIVFVSNFGAEVHAFRYNGAKTWRDRSGKSLPVFEETDVAYLNLSNEGFRDLFK